MHNMNTVTDNSECTVVINLQQSSIEGKETLKIYIYLGSDQRSNDEQQINEIPVCSIN